MKRIFLILLSIFTQSNLAATKTTSTPLDVQKEAIDIVAAISENLAELIIHHKKESNPEFTKQHSVELVRSIAQVIALCIMNAKAKKTSTAQSFGATKGTSNLNILYDQATLDKMIEQIAQSITKQVQATQTDCTKK